MNRPVKLLSALLLTALMGGSLVGCASDGSDDNNIAAPNQPEGDGEVIVVELATLADGANQHYTMTEALDFGTKTNADPLYNKEMIFRVKNSSDEAIAFSMTQSGGTASFVIVENQCGATLAEDATCDVRIEFDGAEFANGEVHDSIIFQATGNILVPAVSENQVSLPLVGVLDVQGNDVAADGDDDGSTSLLIAMATGFDQGSDAVQLVTITNNGSDPAENISLELSSGYSIFSSTCPAHLEEGEACEVLVLYNDYEDLQINDPMMGTLRVSSDQSNDYVLSLTGTDVQEEN